MAAELIVPSAPVSNEVHSNQMAELSINFEDLVKAIKEAKSDSSPGPNGIPNILSIKCVRSLAYPRKTSTMKYFP